MESAVAKMPCGAWPSPLGSADLVRGALRLSNPQWQRGTLFWIEGRPEEGGRQVIMAGDRRSDGTLGGLREMSPSESNIRTRVHEYGGGEYALSPDRLFFVDDRDRGLYVQDLAAGSVRAALPPQRLSRGDSNFADLVCSPDGRFLVAVEERPRPQAEPENRLVVFALPAAGTGVTPCDPKVIAAGHDFYASPTFSPLGDQLAFLAWDHPEMPWTSALLETMAWGRTGASGTAQPRAGGPSESIFQPRFAPDGRLFAMSDAAGFWNLVLITEDGCRPLHHESAELGRAHWVFGQSSWDFISPTTVLASATQDGSDEWRQIDLETGRSQKRPSVFCQISGIAIEAGWLACLGGAPSVPTGLYVGRVGEPGICVRKSSDLEIAPNDLSSAQARVFEDEAGHRTHAFVYAPQSSAAVPHPGERPPLLIKTHGGPTSAASSALDPRIQFWTSRGFAVADVNYRGSTGYGRAYRDALAGAWGVADVEDCVTVASSLAREGFADSQRLAISGGSAGGYTTLCALTFHSLFAAGASHYGIGDLEALVRDTHKFESRYTDWLIAPWPEGAALYRERSPFYHHERLDCPMIFFQGLEDRVVPPNQAEAMVSVLADRGIAHAYVPFEGEQHGFRKAENIRTALDGELYFYSRVFGFEAPQPAAVQVVAGAERLGGRG